MTKTYCDKCGKEVNIPYSQAFYKIAYIQMDLKCNIDLCGECSGKLGKWLNDDNNESVS